MDGLFGELKAIRKQAQREALQEAINHHFRVLMTSHRLLDQVEVDDDFGLRYLDQAGRPIGMGSLSSGMKQLMATALLCGHRPALGPERGLRQTGARGGGYPPLARIDSGHQEAILIHYYPNAAAQVIMLPTDAELDTRKLKLIGGHVYRGAYRLSNPDGEHTEAKLVAVTDLIGEG